MDWGLARDLSELSHCIQVCRLELSVRGSEIRGSGILPVSSAEWDSKPRARASITIVMQALWYHVSSEFSEPK